MTPVNIDLEAQLLRTGDSWGGARALSSSASR